MTTTRQAYLKEYYDIWDAYYMASIPTGEQRDEELAALQRRYPGELPPPERPSFSAGDWVGDHTDEISPIFGVIKDVMEEPDGWFINLIVYAPHGEKVGRRSPACDGPKNFEPFIPADRFKRISSPTLGLDSPSWVAQSTHL